MKIPFDSGIRTFSESPDIVVLGAVPMETGLLHRIVTPVEEIVVAGTAFSTGTFGTRRIVFGSTGIGKVNAAVTTTAILERFSPREVWNVGCAGAFPERGPVVGDVVVSTFILFGDEGVWTEREILSPEVIGIPVFTGPDGTPRYDKIPTAAVHESLPLKTRVPEGFYRCNETDSIRAVPCSAGDEGSFRLHYGPTLTVGMASGDDGIARLRSRRYHALSEDMEGSGVVLACLRYGVPVVECRGISNTAGDRRKENWRFGEAVSHSLAILLRRLMDG